MKKYLSALVSLFFCLGLAAFFAFTEPNPEAVFGHRPAYDWLSVLWFYIGIITSILTVMILAIHDLFTYWDRRTMQHRIERKN
jgi:protein-S-isoprenylcysteine O-methyltransferase Ste14